MNIRADAVTCPCCNAIIEIPRGAIRINFHGEPDAFSAVYECKCGLYFPRGKGSTKVAAIEAAYSKAISLSIVPLSHDQIAHLPPRVPVVCVNYKSGVLTFCSAFLASLDQGSKEYGYYRTIPTPEAHEAIMTAYKEKEAGA